MKVKTWVPLVLAVVLGLFAAKLTRDSIARGRAPAPQVSMSVMVTAARDIEPGQKLGAEMLTTGKVASASVPAGAFQSTVDVADRVVLTRLVKDQPILESMLAPQGTAAGVQALIPPGMRAITVEVNEFSGLAGLITPGCRVDVVTVVRPDEQSKIEVARTIIQNVEVRAVGRQISAADPSPAAGQDAPQQVPNNVTLLVTPEQAEAMRLAGAGGQPWLVLRNGRDAAPVESEGTSVADLRGLRKPPVADPVPRPEPVVPAEVVPTAIEEDDDDVFRESPPVGSDPLAPVVPPAPRTRDVTFIRGTKEEIVQVDLPPEQRETVTDLRDATDGK
jgi:pilus assembly protein CpaB